MFVASRSSHLLVLVLECCCLSCSLYKEVSSCGQKFISLLFCQLMACHKKEQVIVGRLPPTKNTPTLEMGANGWCGIFLERFRKIRKLSNFRNAARSTQYSENTVKTINSGNSGNCRRSCSFFTNS